MKNRARSAGIFVFVSLAAWSAQGRPAATDAEYAIRWSPAQGGPANASIAGGLLGLAGGSEWKFEVRYFSVVMPSDAPRGATAILRERSWGSNTEITWKYRSDATDNGAAPWTCPLRKANERKEEMDISLLVGGAVKRSLSRSCTSPVSFVQAVPPTLSARQRGCVGKVRRLKWKNQGVKVEEWQLSDGTAFIELSWNARDTPADLRAFNLYAKPLFQAGAQPLDRSKTDLGIACLAR